MILVKDLEKIQAKLIEAEKLINRIAIMGMSQLAYTADYTEQVNQLCREYLKTEQTYDQFAPRLKKEKK